MHSHKKYDPIKTSHDREGMLKKTRDLSLLWQVIDGSLHIDSLRLFTPPPSIARENQVSFRNAIKRFPREMMSGKPLQKKPMLVTCQ